MPFTFSHPAAVLPLAYLPKRFISMTGLVIGSMAPDFEYFLRMRGYSLYSHTWAGLFWFDLPASIIAAFVFHLIVRDALIDNLPGVLAKRLLIFKDFDWTKYFKENFLVIIISIIAGVATHILWDALTHENGLFVHAINELQSNSSIAGHLIPRYKLLQHLSTIVGGLIVIYALFQLPADRSFVKQKSIFSYWLSIGIITFIIVTISLLIRGYYFSKDLIIVTITGVFAGTVLAPKILPPGIIFSTKT